MNPGRMFFTLILLAILALAVPSIVQANTPEITGLAVGPNEPMSSAFTYQGYLRDGSSPAEGNYDFLFDLYDAEEDGTLLGSLPQEDMAVVDGYFTVALNYGAGAFNGEAHWLEISVRPGSETGAHTLLTPRQALTAVPHASYAATAPWGGLAQVPAGFADDIDNDTLFTAGAGLTLDGTTFSVDGSVMQLRVTGVCGEGYAIREVYANGTVICEADNDTTYTAGDGLVLTDTEFSADTSYLQQRVSEACGNGFAMSAIADDGSVTCVPYGSGDIDAVIAGTGLTGGGISGTVTVTLNTAYTDGMYWMLGGNTGLTVSDTFGTSDAITLTFIVSGTPGLSLAPTAGGPDLSATVNEFSLSAAGGVTWSVGGPFKINGYTVWTEENDGSSSGMDADLLDGLHASDFASSSHGHDHGALSNLDDDDHPQYFALAQDEPITGNPAFYNGAIFNGGIFTFNVLPAFNGGTSSSTAPFTVDSTFLVTNLNADYLGGYHASNLPFYWMLGGNAGTSPGTNFLGTTDAQPLVLRTNNAERVRVDANGLVGLGTSAPTERLTVNGNTLLLGEDAPAALGYTSTNLDHPWSIHVAGHYAYVASTYNNRLAIFDISEPDNIVALGYTSANLDQPYSVYVAGRYAYVASGMNDRLVVFDVSNPNNIVALGYTSTNLDYPFSVYVAGRYAYVASRVNSRLSVFDISDPNNLAPLGSIGTYLSDPMSVYVAGCYAYVADRGSGRLAIFDVSNPANLVAMGYTSTHLSYPLSVYVAGRYAYVASYSNNSLVIFDISDPSNIIALGYTSTNLQYPYSVFVAGRYAYVASSGNHRLAVFDISDPSNLTPLGYTSTNLSEPRSVTISGRYAFVAASGNNNLAVFDLNHLEAPTADIGNLHTDGLYVGENTTVGNNLYVQGSLNVGTGGALINGDVSVQGNLFAHASITTVTSSTTLVPAQSGIVLVNNAAVTTITLPNAASSTGLTFTIKRLTANAVTVASAGGTIDGAATQALAAQYDFITLVSDGANWYIIGR